MKVCLTIDMEQDCPPYLNTYRGVEGGTSKLLELFAGEGVPATFFTTGDVARRFPKIISKILDNHHELGCHGDTHRRFDSLSPRQAQEEIRNSTKTLRDFGPVTSFRAPNLIFPEEYLKFLEEDQYQLDSSQAKYKRTFTKGIAFPTSLTRVPASVTSSVLRLPKAIRYPWFHRLRDPVVLFVHPWEFIDLRKEKLRLDCRFRTGETALHCLKENIHFFKRKGARFLRMRDLVLQSSESPP